MVCLLTQLASPAQGTGTGEGVQGGEVAAAPVTAGRGVAGVVHRGLAQRVGEAQGAGAGEGGDLALVLVHHAAPSVLTDLLPRAAGVEVLAVFSNIFRGASSKQSHLVTGSELLEVNINSLSNILMGKLVLLFVLRLASVDPECVLTMFGLDISDWTAGTTDCPG